jgi:hypothetical protein
MTLGLAFLPWVAVKDRLDAGPLTLLPYRLKRAPGDQPGVSQAQMDAVLSSYAERPGRPIKEATIVEIDNWRSGADPAPALERLYEAREALAFSALADRRLFSGHFGYCSFDAFALVVQSFSAAEPSRFAYMTRRRDGGTHNLWSSDEFAFHQPLHVHKSLGLTCDEKLLTILLSNRNEIWSDAICEFNRANTDSPDVPIHVEMIMVKSAFERLFEIDQSWQAFEQALLVKVGEAATRREVPTPLTEKWSEVWPRATRPIAAWAREFCARRGAAAHGVDRAGKRFVWSEAAHLAFAAILFPLILRKGAADEGNYALTAADAERLRRVDEYVTCDPFSSLYDRVGGEPHPWNLVDDECRAAEIAARMPEWPE